MSATQAAQSLESIPTDTWLEIRINFLPARHGVIARKIRNGDAPEEVLEYMSKVEAAQGRALEAAIAESDKSLGLLLNRRSFWIRVIRNYLKDQGATRKEAIRQLRSFSSLVGLYGAEKVVNEAFKIVYP